MSPIWSCVESKLRPLATTCAVNGRSTHAAFGGVTTIIDFDQPLPSQSLLNELDLRQEDAKGQTVID